jgi:hypothetical protein
MRGGSATPSISPSESASNIGVTRSVLSRATRRSVAPYRPRSVTRSPSPILSSTPSRIGRLSKAPSTGPLFFSENGNEDDGFDAMSCASYVYYIVFELRLIHVTEWSFFPSLRSNPIDIDDNDDAGTLLATRGGKHLPADSPRSTPTSRPSSSVATENLPKFKPHPGGFDLNELRLLQDEIMVQVFSHPAIKPLLEEKREEYGFNSVFELRKLTSEIHRRGLDSNEGKFFTTSIEDPRRQYPKKTVVDDPANPMCID